MVRLKSERCEFTRSSGIAEVTVVSSVSIGGHAPAPNLRFGTEDPKSH